MQYSKAKTTSKKIKTSLSLRNLFTAALVAGGAWQLAPFIASSQTAPLTPAGTEISNTATGTYEDPNNPGTTLNTTSNTVTATVAEVAGISLVPTGLPEDVDGGTIDVGDLIRYTFTITNVGNDPTRFRIPNLATTTGPGTVSGDLEYSIDGGTTFLPITATELITNSIPVGGTVLVRVPVTVAAGAVANDVITVRLGNTTGSTSSQNVALLNNGGDVYTVDNPDGTPNPVVDEINGLPLNGERESSSTQQVTVGALTKNLALATLLKTRGDYTNVAPLTTLVGDTVDYALSLRVENTDVTGQGITPQPLAGFEGISVDASTATNYILISDVIPTGTVLSATPTAPSGWDAVYSTVAPTADPNAVLWTRFSTTAPTLSDVTRVGFVRSTGTTASPTTANYIAPGTTVTGFSIQVAVSPEPTPPLSINNIAQLIGQTPNGGLPIYDESGDQNPSNYDGPIGAMVPGVTDANGDGLPDSPTLVTDSINSGVADPANQGVDSGNNNTGSGIGGEVNVLQISPPAPTAILNGPLNTPTATGPDGTTATDFTNKSSLIPAGTVPGSTLDPEGVSFGNTIQNNGTDPGTVTLVPTPPANILDLPDETTVTITYLTQTVTYTYDQPSGTFTTTGTPISIPAVAPGASINYGVEVNLPSGTKLSTDTSPDYTGDTEWGYPVPITATITSGLVSSSNITIDRVFTGYLQLIKVSRILQGTGSPVVGTQGTFSSDPKTPTPGNIIEYQIRYTNISSGQSGSGSVVLNASQIVITEENGANGNNWADVNPTSGIIYTSNITAPQASDSNGGLITFFPSGNQSGTTQATDVTRYVNTVNSVLIPQGQGTFTFQRKVN